MSYFRRFWIKKPRHSENVSDQKCYLCRRTCPQLTLVQFVELSGSSSLRRNLTGQKTTTKTKPTTTPTPTDSTIASPPLKQAILRDEIFMTVLDTRKDVPMDKMSSCMFWHAKGYRTMTSGWQGASYSRRHVRELVPKQANSLNNTWGGLP